MYRVPVLIVAIALTLSACDSSPNLTPRDVAEIARHKEYGSAKVAFESPQLVELAQAACFGEASHVANLIRRGVNPNSEGALWNEGGTANLVTPLIWAIDCRSADGIEALLRAGAKPNYRPPYSTDGRTPVHIAAGLESTAPLQVLIRYRGDPNSGTWNSPSWALQAAFDLGAKVGDWRNYYFLLNSGADINREYGDETIALHAVIRGRFDKSAYYDKVLELLKRGYSHDLTDLASSMNISWICGTTVSLSVEQQKAKDDVILVLKGRGVKFPVPPPVERTSGTVTLETDSSLSVWWHGGHSTCGKAVPIKFQIVKPTDPSYKVILKRVGGLKRYQTKDILRQANDPLR